MKVISTKSSTTLGALAEARVIAAPNTLRAKDMETFGEDGILLPCTATWTVELGLERRGEEQKEVKIIISVGVT